MKNLRCMHPLRSWLFLVLFVFTSACSFNFNNEPVLYEGDDFTFSAPARYETKLYETPLFDKTLNYEVLLFANVGHYPYFLINRQAIPAGGDLDTAFADYQAIINARYTYHFQFISQDTITFDDRAAIEYVHREVIGEPYVQTWEIWMEYNGWAYSLVCVTPADGTPGAVIPISETCIQLAEGFQFK